MKESDSLIINLKIIEQLEPLRLRIPREKEEVYRKATDSINSAIKEYRKKFPVTPSGVILSMVTINFAVSSLQASNNKDIDPLLIGLEKLNAELQTYLNEEISK